MLARRAFPSWDTSGRLQVGAGAKMNNDGIALIVGVIKAILELDIDGSVRM